MVDGPTLSVVASAAATAVATKYLSDSDSKILGVLAEREAVETYVRAATNVREIREAIVWTEDTHEIRPQVEGVEIHMASSPAECFQGVDVATMARPAIAVHDEWIEDTMHVNLVRAVEREHVDPTLLERSRVVVDDLVVDDLSHASWVSEGAPPYPWSVTSPRDAARRTLYGEIGEIAAGMKESPKDQLSVFISTGLALQDVAAANIVYREVKEKEGPP